MELFEEYDSKSNLPPNNKRKIPVSANIRKVNEAITRNMGIPSSKRIPFWTYLQYFWPDTALFLILIIFM
jgi:hypothetical protein